jgi:hypothetical protein
MERSWSETRRTREVESDHARWHVREVLAVNVPGAPRDFCLIFDRGTVCRRLWTYPSDWLELEDEALLALMDQLR